MDVDIIRTGTWQVTLPADWVDLEDSEAGGMHFESGDGTKALQVATWKIARLDVRSSQEVGEAFRKTNLLSLHRMEGYVWEVIADQSVEAGDVSVALTDTLAREQNYRIVGKTLTCVPTIVRATFHDYLCEDYEQSRLYFEPIIDSLRFSELGE